MIIYTVQPGDSLSVISEKSGVPVSQIARENVLSVPDRLPVGLGLFLSTDFVRHTVLPGESLFSIAEIYGITFGEILSSNPQIANQSALYPGQTIYIEATQPSGETVSLNGYGVVPINQEVLGNTLPYLTFLSVFDYKFNSNGNITPPPASGVTGQARRAETASLMVLTNVGRDGFDSNAISSVLANEDVQQNLISNVINILETENFYGINIDIEYVYPSDKTAYNTFLRNITSQLRNRGFYVSSALAPKTSVNQRGILYESHDYAFNGRVMDSVTLMTYEWGYTYSSPQSVAPINQVRRVLDFGITQIPPEKIFLGVPNYGYDWTLPHIEGSAAKAVTIPYAINLASRYGATIQFDRPSQTPYFYYTDGNVRHVVWFEDARSVYSKMQLIAEYGLGGASYWNINSFYPPMQLIPNYLYNINRIM